MPYPCAAVRGRIASNAAAFSPLSIPGLKLWLKADGTLWQDSARTTPAIADGDPVGGLGRWPPMTRTGILLTRF